MIAEKIKEWRVKNHMTQEQAARFLRVSLKTINNWESGRTAPPAYIEKIIK